MKILNKQLSHTLIPHIGCEIVKFGMRRAECQKAIGIKAPKSKLTPDLDHYKDIGISLGYDQGGFLDYIQVQEPGVAIIENIKINWQERLSTVVSKLDTALSTHKHFDGSYNYKKHGIILYAPLGKIECVSGYRDGYYDGIDGY
jgi:hypothetical protein